MGTRKPASAQQVREFTYSAGFPDLLDAWRTITTALKTRFPSEFKRISKGKPREKKSAPAAGGQS